MNCPSILVYFFYKSVKINPHYPIFRPEFSKKSDSRPSFYSHYFPSLPRNDLESSAKQIYFSAKQICFTAVSMQIC